jgi:uncharacterized peroxidase-related enzyme
MSRIPTPATIQDAPEASQSSLEAVNNLLGVVPNMFRLISNSPQTLEGYLSLNSSLGNGSLDTSTRERIALAVAEVNSCDYCLAAHNYLGTNVAKLSPEEIESNRNGSSRDPKAAAAVEFAVKITKNRGQVSDGDLQTVRDAGYSNAEIIEIIGHVALNTLTNLMNEVLGTNVDFPAVEAL